MYDRSSTKNKWTIMKYIKSFEKMISYADAVRQGMADISDEALELIQNNMQDLDIYHPRFKKPNYVTIRNKVNQIVFYMFGYKFRKGKEYKIVMSPLGNLLLDNKDNNKFVPKIFLTMLYSMEFKHPFNKMSNEFRVYPYRIIFQLLLDERLDGKLYHDEVFYFVMYLKSINRDIYEKLIEDILEFREKTPEEKYQIFKKDEWVVANALHEWNYATGMMKQAGIVEIKNDDNEKNYGVLIHGDKDSGRRSYKLNYIRFNDEVRGLATKLSDSYPFDEEVLWGTDKYLRSEYINKIYTFYPKELIEELGIIGEEEERVYSILNITDQIDKYARNEDNKTFGLFEDVLCDAFNLFYNVRAEKIAKSGTTDIDCIYYMDNDKSKKFDVEAKARKVKLVEISAGRLRAHREEVGSNYTIVVTPEYLPAVKEDIKYSDTVIILSGTLSNFLYQYSVKYGREIDYKIIDDIVEKNRGKDITNYINEYISNYLATNC
ncbi:hypothetical protein [Clostridium paraputrificum]|uniref:hypothetical protein n=1 Tax=Clostridium paraputrificum TaxID=29363 RepID=UPI0034A4ADFE